MRNVFVQSCNTKEFIGTNGSWTQSPESARDFITSLNALAHCLSNELREAQVVIRFSDPAAPDVIVPIDPDMEEIRQQLMQ